MKDEPTLKNKLSPLIKGQLADFIQSDHQVYASFVRDFYKFLESAKITYKATTNYLIQEPETKAYVLSENGVLGAPVDRMVLEDSVEFATGEIVKGQTSGAEATVVVEDVRGSALYISANQRFEIGETIKGLTSGAETELVTYKANPVQNVQQLLEYADIDNTILQYFDQFRESFLKVIPNTLASEVSKRKLIKSIKDLYSAKGTSEGHKIFMRLLLNESANIFYPNENMLKVSNGNWKQKDRIRCVSDGLGASSEILNQVITGLTSGATAVVDATATFQQGINSVSELELENVNGTFQSGEKIEATSNETDTKITFTIKSTITGTSLDNDGILHSLSEALVIDSDKGNGFADVLVDTVKEGSVSSVHIETGGNAYEVGDKVNFTGGTGITAAAGFVSAVGGAFLLEDGTGNIQREVGTVNTEVSFNVALEKKDLSDGPYYVYGTAEYGQLGAGKEGYFYPLYLTAAGAGGTSNSHTHTFSEYPDVVFHMPAGNMNHAVSDLPTNNTNTAWPPKAEDNIILDRTDSSGSDAGDKIETNEVQLSLDANVSDSDVLILERGTFSTETEATSINRVFLTSKGQGYTSLPTISVDSEDGTSAKLIALTNDIGAVGSLRVNDSGLNYDADNLPDARFRAHFILKDITGSFVAGNTLSSHTGTVKAWNATTQQLDVTFEDIKRIDMELSTDFSLPFILEDQDSANNENNILMEDIQLVDTTINDNIILDGTSITSAPTRFVNTDVKVKQEGIGVYKFIVDNVEQKELILNQGFTYKFDLSDSSLYSEVATENHPFLFSLTSDGTHNSGTEYTSGVTKSPITIATGTEGAFIQIVIPLNSPTLFYYNGNWEGAGGTIKTIKVPDTINDENGTILLDGTGVNKHKMLIEPVGTENPLLGIAFEDNSGTVILESSNTSVIQDEGVKLVIDGLIDDSTAFILNESSGEPMKTEDHGNLILTEAGDTLVFETDETTGGDKIVLDGTDASSNNAGDSLIFEDKIDFSNNDVVITDSGGASGTIILADIARGSVSAGVTQKTEGSYLNIKSLIDEDLIRIQDSYYYQQFSYEVQVGQSTASYLNELKKAVHPAGFAPFGKVSIATFLSAAVSTTGSTMKAQPDSVSSFSPILASTLELVFDEVFSRRHSVPKPDARISSRDEAIVIDGTATSATLLDGSDGSSTDAGDNLLLETGSNVLNETEQNSGENILFEDGTFTNIGGLGGKLMSEDAHAPGNTELVFVPTYKVVVQSQARSR